MTRALHDLRPLIVVYILTIQRGRFLQTVPRDPGDSAERPPPACFTGGSGIHTQWVGPNELGKKPTKCAHAENVYGMRLRDAAREIINLY